MTTVGAAGNQLEAEQQVLGRLETWQVRLAGSRGAALRVQSCSIGCVSPHRARYPPRHVWLGFAHGNHDGEGASGLSNVLSSVSC